MLPTKELVIFDLETTDPNEAMKVGSVPEIVELGAIRIHWSFEIADRCSFLVRPVGIAQYTEYCERLTGISRADLEQAPSWKELWEEFVKLTKYRDVPVCSWGTEYDIPILKASYQQLGLGFPHGAVIDAKSIVYALAGREGHMFRNWRLRTVCDYFGIKHEPKHRALADTQLILSIFKAIAKRGGDEEEYKLIEF